MSDTREDQSPEAQAFVTWARERIVPLSIPRHDEGYEDMRFLREVVANKRIVTFGETAHYMHEWNRWRARLFKYLADNHGFNTFVLESGLVEGRNVHDYVAGKDVDWETVVASITNAWGVWAELNEMIRWMRDYNANPGRDRELRFYCMDGTGNWSHATHAYRAVHDFARRVDENLAEDLARDLEAGVKSATFETRAQIERDTWHALIANASLVVSRIEQSRLDYVAASSQDDYEWALRSAQILRDVLVNLAQVELDFSLGFRHFWNVRDVSMAQSIQWILDREGPDSKLVVAAHNSHLQQTPVRVQRATSMGSYLVNQIDRNQVLFIGAASAQSVKDDAPSADCNQAVYDRIGPDCFFLDLRKAPRSGPVWEWLTTERADRSNLRYQPVTPGLAWDCLVFHRTLRIGEVELPASLQAERGTMDASALEALTGRYLILGFMSAVNTLDVTCNDGVLHTNGQDDTSGELFPPYETPVWVDGDGCFRWDDWPAILEFHHGAGAGKITITMPGMGVYHGVRAEQFDESLVLPV